jgi:serine/threonine protein kinase
MEYLHENNIYHFHLSSRNVLIQDDFTPRICDYGFHYFKEIASIFLKYKNKNGYTCPELLKDNRNISNITGTDENFRKCDVYSFGMLLWELYTCTIPFDVKLTTVYDFVVKDNYRPEITKDFNHEIANLIRLCWDSDVKKRPEFKEIIQIINKINIV